MSAIPVQWSVAQASAQPPFDGVWLHAQPAETIDQILRLGWDPEKLQNTIFGTAVYLSRRPWNGRKSWFACELDVSPGNTRATFASTARGDGSTDDHLLEELREQIVLSGVLKKVGRTAGRGNNQPNTRIRDHFLGQNVVAVAFDETGDKVVAVYDPSVIRIQKVTTELVCSGRGGVETPLTFEITQPSSNSWRYIAWDPGRTDFFEAQFKTLGDRLYIEGIDHHHAARFFTGRGVPGTVFAHLASITGSQIVSATNRGAKVLGTEFRSVSAERMWQGLARRGRASYEAAEDRYRYIP